MLKFKLVAIVVRALSGIAAATKKDSAGGKKITPDERDEILGAVVSALADYLDGVVDEDDAGE